MEERKLVRCVDCGFLARRACLQGEWRAHEGYHEADKVFRNNPKESFHFVPGSINALNQGELNCYRQAADLLNEIALVRASRTTTENLNNDPARDVLYKERECAKYFPYEPGIDPPGHLLEQKAATLEEDRRKFDTALVDFQADLNAKEARQNKWLAWLAFYVTLVVGLIQLLTSVLAMTPDAIGIDFGRWVYALPHDIAAWFGRLFQFG
jgi:hypothetical protein